MLCENVISASSTGFLKYLENNKNYSESDIRNLLNGYGLAFIDNCKMEGEWINNKLDGYGLLIYPNGNFYEGQFKKGKKV